jgi:hypothetical protein
MIGLSRSEAYRAADAGDIPTKRDGYLLRVPRARWDRIKEKLARAEAGAI